MYSKGWITNVYGPTAFCAAYMKGLCRFMILKKHVNATIIPVDFVANLVIASTMKTAIDFSKQRPFRSINGFAAEGGEFKKNILFIILC